MILDLRFSIELQPRLCINRLFGVVVSYEHRPRLEDSQSDQVDPPACEIPHTIEYTYDNACSQIPPDDYYLQ